MGKTVPSIPASVAGGHRNQPLTLGCGVAVGEALVLPDPHEVPAGLLVPVALDDATIVLPGLIVALCAEGKTRER